MKYILLNSFLSFLANVIPGITHFITFIIISVKMPSCFLLAKTRSQIIYCFFRTWPTLSMNSLQWLFNVLEMAKVFIFYPLLGTWVLPYGLDALEHNIIVSYV